MPTITNFKYPQYIFSNTMVDNKQSIQTKQKQKNTNKITLIASDIMF